MWCLINLPNGTTSAVQCDPKRNSQECLEKVCSDLGIVCETDYFGLIPVRDGDSSIDVDECSAKQWINLRNPLSLHANDRNHPIQLSLRVKFWVPAHLILQDSVRLLFYMQARQELLDQHISPSSWANAAYISALLLQADGYKYDPAKVVVNLAVGAIERRQSRRPSKRKCSETDVKRGSISPVGIPEDGPTDETKPKNLYQSYIVRPTFEDTEVEPMPINFIEAIAKEHETLTKIKMTPTSAQYWLLEEISSLGGYGEEVFEGVTISEPPLRCKIGVSPHGLLISKEEQNYCSVPFTAVKAAKSVKRSFRLTYLSEEHEEMNIELKLPNHRTAASLYRAITEKHVFYSCETVRPVVTTQFIRDLKGTIASMFNEDTELGKRYVFDIQRTCREVYDNSRRVLHARGIEISKVQQECPQAQAEQLEQQVAAQAEESTKLDRLVDERILEAVTCIICADNAMDTMFLPCGHIAACRQCAEQCDRCPLCRADIESINKAFLPPVLRSRGQTASAQPNSSGPSTEAHYQ